jgi:hypothetical protein
MTPTTTEIITQYLDNSGYQTLEQAKLYQQAIRQLIIKRPKETIIDGQKIAFDISILRDELNRVNQFVDQKQMEAASAQGNDGHSRTYDLRNIRD